MSKEKDEIQYPFTPGEMFPEVYKGLELCRRIDRPDLWPQAIELVKRNVDFEEQKQRNGAEKEKSPQSRGEGEI